MHLLRLERVMVYRFLSLLVAALVLATASCTMDRAPEGLRRTPEGPGSTVVFDPTRRPVPEVPLPNDVATFSDPTSRTGRRVTISLHATSSMEEAARRGLNDL